MLERERGCLWCVGLRRGVGMWRRCRGDGRDRVRLVMGVMAMAMAMEVRFSRWQCCCLVRLFGSIFHQQIPLRPYHTHPSSSPRASSSLSTTSLAPSSASGVCNISPTLQATPTSTTYCSTQATTPPRLPPRPKRTPTQSVL